jgi:phosphatidylglycerophosphate synthase
MMHPWLAASAVRNDAVWTTSGPRKYLVCSSLLVSAASQLALFGVVLLAIAASLESLLPLTWHFVATAVGCHGVVSALVFAGLPRHAPHGRFGFANSVTLTRALLTALLWGVIAEQLFGETSVLGFEMRWLVVAGATVALLSDGLDGWAARRSGMASDFGAYFDMEVDALFLLALATLVHATGNVGAWVLASGLLRYAFVLSGHAWPRLATPLVPLWRRKTICVLQFAALIGALIPIVPSSAAQMLCLGGLALLCYSFAADLVWLASRALPYRTSLNKPNADRTAFG